MPVEGGSKRLLVAALIPLAFTGAGLIAMRYLLRPVAEALPTPRSTSAGYRLLVGARPLPDIIREAPAEQDGPDWVVLGWTRGRDSARIARSAMDHAGAAIRCTRAAPACDGKAGAARADVELCAEVQPLRRLGECAFDACERLTLLTFVQRSTQIDFEKLRRTCRQESERWLQWNPSRQEPARPR
jgi:hypothetical protein